MADEPNVPKNPDRGDDVNPGSDHGHGRPVTVDGRSIIFGEASDLGARYFYMPGEILVWADDADEVLALLEADGQGTFRIEDGSRTFSKISFESQLGPLEIADIVTARGFDASPNHVFRMTSHKSFIGVGLPEKAKPTKKLEAQIESARRVENGPVVAVIDTGIAKTSNLPDTVVPVGDAHEEQTDPASTTFGHGTFVAGLIAAECPEAEIRMIRPPYETKDHNGFGQLTDLQFAQALEVVLEMASEVDILNLSLGGFTHDSRPPLASGAVISELLRRGVTVVAGAGNDGRRGDPFYPAAQDGVLAVGCADHDGNRSCFSNRGDWVDFLAVGERVVSLFPVTKVSYPDLPAGGPDICPQIDAFDADTLDFPTGWAMWSGTSFAAARVSGALARTKTV